MPNERKPTPEITKPIAEGAPVNCLDIPDFLNTSIFITADPVDDDRPSPKKDETK